jgi:hypothetical protein
VWSQRVGEKVIRLWKAVASGDGWKWRYGDCGWRCLRHSDAAPCRGHNYWCSVVSKILKRERRQYRQNKRTGHWENNRWKFEFATKKGSFFIGSLEFPSQALNEILSILEFATKLVTFCNPYFPSDRPLTHPLKCQINSNS